MAISQYTGWAAPVKAKPLTVVKKTVTNTTNTNTNDNNTVDSSGGYEPMAIDTAAIWEQAGQMADEQINSQLAEIDNQLQQAGYDAKESQLMIDRAYPIARRSLQKSIYENFVAGEGSLAAMGTGRGGGRQELLGRAGERVATGIENIETQKMNETGAISRALANMKGQLNTTKRSVIASRPGLVSGFASGLTSNAVAMGNYNLNARQLADQEAAYQNSLKTATSGGASPNLLQKYTNGGALTTVTNDDINAVLGGNPLPGQPVTNTQGLGMGWTSNTGKRLVYKNGQLYYV
jgi:hypothetical protein